MEGWHYEPEQIDQVHTHDRQRHSGKAWHSPLDTTRQQEQERKDEVYYKQRQPDPLPATLGTVHIPGNLLWQIPRPDNQELGKSDVGPEHNEGQQKVPEVVKMGRSDHAGKRCE